MMLQHISTSLGAKAATRLGGDEAAPTQLSPVD